MTEKLPQSITGFVFTERVRNRLLLHLNLDHNLRDALRRYVRYHQEDSQYWEEICKPYINLMPEHYRLAQLTSHRLKHYTQHLRRLMRLYPRQRPSAKRAQALLDMVETWYWREYP
jgi:hypothetical protein